MYNKIMKNNIYGRNSTPHPNNYIIDFSEIQNAYTISHHGAIVDSGEGHQLFSMMQRIQQNDLSQNRRSTFQIRTNSIYTGIGGIS